MVDDRLAHALAMHPPESPLKVGNEVDNEVAAFRGPVNSAQFSPHTKLRKCHV